MERLDKLFDHLDDKYDIFQELKQLCIKNDFLVSYKEFSEYGVTIRIFNMNGEELTKILMSASDEKNLYFITSFTYFGIEEKNYSNRTEYYICGNYYSSSINDKIKMYQNKINDVVFNEHSCPELRDFIKSSKKIELLPLDTLYNLEENMLICNFCCSEIIPIENQCDFCDKKLCEKCCEENYYSFTECLICNTQWCYYNGLHIDYKCTKMKMSGNCEGCC